MCPRDATPPTLLPGFPLPLGLSETTRSSHSPAAGASGEGNSVLIQLSSPFFPTGHVSRFSHCLSARAAYSPGELYLPDGEASSRLPDRLKALLPLQPVSGCVPRMRWQSMPRLTQGPPTPLCSLETPFAKTAELQAMIQNWARMAFIQGDVLAVLCLC